MAVVENAPARGAAESVDVIAPLLHHINLKTTRKEEMIAWYGAVCGMKVNYDSPFGAFLSNDAANHRIALTVAPGIVPDPDRRHHDGLHHSAFEYGSLADLDSTFRRLRDAGIDPILCVDHRLAISYYYEDPDGNLVELQCDVFGSWEASTEWMHTALLEITEHQLGVIVDPELVSKDIRVGITMEELRERSEAGAYRWAGEPDLRLPAPPPGAPSMFKP